MSDCVGRVQRIPHKKRGWVEVRASCQWKYLTIDYEARHQMSHFFLSTATTAQQLGPCHAPVSHTQDRVCGHICSMVCACQHQAHTAEPDKHTPAEIKVCTHCSKAVAPVRTVTEGLRMRLAEEHWHIHSIPAQIPRNHYETCRRHTVSRHWALETRGATTPSFSLTVIQQLKDSHAK